MSDEHKTTTAVKADKRSFSSFLKSNLGAIFSHLGMTLFVIIVSYLVVLLATHSINGELFFLIDLVAVLLALAFFPLCLALGFLLPVVSSKVTRNSFAGCWLILFLMSAGTLLLGFFLQEGQLLAASPPAFLASVLAQLDIFTPLLGIYLMLYGGASLLSYTYCPGVKMFWPTGLLKMLLGGIIILATVCWATYNAWVNEDDPYPLSLACFVIQFFGMGASVLFGLSKAYLFARSRNGRAKPFFVPLYILNAILAIAGILLIVGAFGADNFVIEFLNFLLYRQPEAVIAVLKKYVSLLNHEFISFFTGLCLLLLYGSGLIGIGIAQMEKCKYCGRYACRSTTDTSETSRVTGRERVTEKDTFLSFDKYGYTEETFTTTNDYQTVSGKTHYEVYCAYCGKYLGSGSSTWKHTEKIDSNSKKEVTQHIWYE